MATAVDACQVPILQFLNNLGQPNAGGSILTQVGGVNYPTYQDSAGATPLPNPIPLNSRGEVSNSSGQSTQLFLEDGVTYTFTLYDASQNQIWQATSIAPMVSQSTLTASGGAALVGYIQGGTGSVSTTVQGALRRMVWVADFGADTTGANSAVGDFVNADAASGGDLWVGPGTYKIDANLTLSSYVHFTKGAILDISNGVTVTFNSSIEAPYSQIFSLTAGTGGGAVAFSGPAMSVAYPQWWGAKLDNTTDDTNALEGAEACGLELFLSTGTSLATTKRNAALYWGPGALKIGGYIQPTRKVGQDAGGQNILPNTQWMVTTAFPAATKYLAEGTGPMAAISISSYTTGSNTVTCTVSGSTGELKDGDLVEFSSTADPNMLICQGRVANLVANTSFDVQLPLGLAPSTSAACTATPMMRGDVSGTQGAGMDGWSKTTTLLCWRDDQPANKIGGQPYQVGLQKTSTSAELYYRSLDTAEVANVAGKELSFGCSMLHKINAGSTGYWQPFITFNGTGATTVYGIKSTGTVGATEWQEIFASIPFDATSVSCGISLDGSVGDTAYIGECMALPNVQYIGSGNYAPPIREILIPIVKFSPLSWIGAAVTFPATADAAGTYSFGFQVDAETNGVIMPTVRKLQFQVEGFNANTVSTGGTSRVIAFRDVLVPPIKYAVIMGQQVASVKNYACGEWTLSPGTTNNGIVYDSIASDSWANVSIDISGMTLN